MPKSKRRKINRYRSTARRTGATNRYQIKGAVRYGKSRRRR